MAIGSVDSADYQMCEVLDYAAGSGTVSVNVAPRIRKAVAAGAAVTVGAVYGKFNLVRTKTGVEGSLDRSGATLEIKEALA